MAFSKITYGVAAFTLLVTVVPTHAERPVDSLKLSGQPADLIAAPARSAAAWSVESPHAMSVHPVQHTVPEPRVTSLPVAVIVGGLLLASLGVSQHIRRTRTLEA
jgi:hypothetical protein